MTACLKIVAVSCETGLPTAQKGRINGAGGGEQLFTPAGVVNRRGGAPSKDSDHSDWRKVVKTHHLCSRLPPVWRFSELHVAFLHFLISGDESTLNDCLL